RPLLHDRIWPEELCCGHPALWGYCDFTGGGDDHRHSGSCRIVDPWCACRTGGDRDGASRATRFGPAIRLYRRRNFLSGSVGECGVELRRARPYCRPPANAAMTIRVTGHQWWWEIAYADKDVSRTFTTANEIRIPIGKPIRIE